MHTFPQQDPAPPAPEAPAQLLEVGLAAFGERDNLRAERGVLVDFAQSTLQGVQKRRREAGAA
jgi:hypothetical protein